MVFRRPKHMSEHKVCTQISHSIDAIKSVASCRCRTRALQPPTVAADKATFISSHTEGGVCCLLTAFSEPLASMDDDEHVYCLVGADEERLREGVSCSASTLLHPLTAEVRGRP